MSEPKHTYPPGYEPRTGVLRPAYGDIAWKILDTLKPGRLSDPERCFLCGQIAGAMEKAVQDALEGRPLPKPGSGRPRQGKQ